MEEQGKKIVCWFSCGAASACAAKLAIKEYGKDMVRVVNNPVINEHEDNRRFLKDCEDWLGVKIESAINPCFKDCDITKVFDEYGMMSSPHFAPCTLELKQMARQQWERDNDFQRERDLIVLGFTSEETNRRDRFNQSEKNKGYQLWCPLIEEGWNKHRCFNELERAKIKLPEIYTKYEFPNANCIGCVKSGSVWYWNLVKKHFPEVFRQRMEQSRKYGCRLVERFNKGKIDHLFLDELNDDMKGRKPKSCYVECGIFCTMGLKDSE